MSVSIFITRELTCDSVLQNGPWNIIGYSLIKFLPVSIEMVPEANWIFFYSKTGIDHFYQQLMISGHHCDARIATFGPSSAQHAMKYGKVAFVGNGNAEQTARAFSLVAPTQHVIFARAKNSMKSVQKQLDDTIKTIDLVVYDNQMSQDWSNPQADILIFTSPMNARSYAKKLSFKRNQTIISIGQTTKKALEAVGAHAVLIPNNPTEDGLYNLLLSLDLADE